MFLCSPKLSRMKHMIYLLVILQLNFAIFSNNYTKRPKTKNVLKNNPVAAVFLRNALTTAAHTTELCYWLRTSRFHYQKCRNQLNLPLILSEARDLTIHHCEDQFRYDRWNCSKSKHLFRKIFQETAFMYALNAAGITVAIARACSAGKLKRCRCNSKNNNDNKQRHVNSDNTNEHWHWGGCGDNIQFGRRFTRKFLQLRSLNNDFHDSILNHNSEVGIRTVASQMREVCKCHGVSGSCSIRTCWKRVPPLGVAATQLKKKYHRAIKFELSNRSTRRADGKSLHRKWPKGQLLYLERSPTFCSVTANRKCLNRINCATLCCGRGYKTKIRYEERRCNCRWKKNFEMICDRCSYDVEEHFCK